VVRQARLMAVVVRAFLIGCAVLLGVGCAGVRPEAPEEEQGRLPEATTSEEDARCERTRTSPRQMGGEAFTTNDVPRCPKGGLLSGTERTDNLDGQDGDDEIRGLGGVDMLFGGFGEDVMYGGASRDFLYGGQNDDVLYGGPGSDEMDGGGGDAVLYGGAGNDILTGRKGDDVFNGGDGNDIIDVYGMGSGRDKLYCGEGKDRYWANNSDHVSSSCEKKWKPKGIG
jgi:hypothetical protein